MKKFYEFYYNLSAAYFVAGESCAFMDKGMHKLINPALACGKDVYVSAEDIERIYSPYMQTSKTEGGVLFEMNDVKAKVKVGSHKVKVNGKKREMKERAILENGAFYVPVGAFMECAFDKMATYSKDCQLPERAWNAEKTLVCVCDRFEYKEVPGKYVVEQVPREKFEFDQAALSYMKTNLEGKDDGELYKTYWFDMAKKVMPYALYVPSTYDPEKPSKMVVSLHGAGLGEEYIYALSKNKMQFYCEKFNYIFLAPNACTVRSFYGSLIPPIQSPVEDVDEEEAYRRSLGEYSVLAAIDEVERLYNIDKDRVFLMGNSMGSAGTYYISNKYPERFRAICPSGGCLHFELMDLTKWKDIPIRLVGGTEDGGWKNIKRGFKLLTDAGLKAELVPVGGGVHFDSWAWVLEDTFKFFEANS